MARAKKTNDGPKPREEIAAAANPGARPNDAVGETGATAFEIGFDPEGWMSERPRYWLDRGPSMSPSRLASLWRRLREAASEMGASRLDGERRPRTTEEEWIRRSEQALGPLPRPMAADQPTAPREARPVASDASTTPLEADERRAERGAEGCGTKGRRGGRGEQ